MAPEIFSEEIKPRQFQPAPRKMVFVFRQTRNPAKEVFEKLSLKLKGQELPGIEFAEQYLSHLYGRNRRAGTLEHNNISIRFFLEFLKAKGNDCIVNATGSGRANELNLHDNRPKSWLIWALEVHFWHQ